MRAYVRPGGPAYAAGLRTNDIIEKLDGKFWWEYGTYQTEQRAYDGKPHTFEIKRGKETLTIRLGDPFLSPRAESRGQGNLATAWAIPRYPSLGTGSARDDKGGLTRSYY